MSAHLHRKAIRQHLSKNAEGLPGRPGTTRTSEARGPDTKSGRRGFDSLRVGVQLGFRPYPASCRIRWQYDEAAVRRCVDRLNLSAEAGFR